MAKAEITKYCLLVKVICSLIILVFCSCSAADNFEIIDVSGNGGSFVSYNNKVYFWEYNSESFQKIGLFKYYAQNSEVKNKLICMSEDLSTEILDYGYGGNIHIVNNELFYQKEINIIGSIMLNDGKKREFAGFIIDSNGRFLIWDDNGTIKAFDASSKKTVSVGNLESYVILNDHNVYLYKNINNELTINCYDLIRNSNTVICKIVPPGEFVRNSYINEPVVVDDLLFFTFGFLAGTAHIWQGGSLICVDLKNKTVNILDENVDRYFCVIKDGDNINVYCNKNWIAFNDYIYDTKIEVGTLEKTSQGYIIMAPGKIFYERAVDAHYMFLNDGGRIRLINNHDGKNDLTVISVVDDWVYFKDESNTIAPEHDVGWREAYIRNGADIYRKNLKDGEIQRLFRY